MSLARCGACLVVLLIACHGARPAGSPPSGRVADGACPRAHFAVGAERLELYEIDPACTVHLVHQIDGADGLVLWPSARGPVVLYDVTAATDSAPATTLAMRTIASPTTAAGPAPAWKPITFGEGDYDGQLDWGFVSDGRFAYAIACAEWASDNEEEWHCDRMTYLRSDGRVVDDAPVPAFATPIGSAPLADGVILAERDGVLACTSKPPTEDEIGRDAEFAIRPVAVVPRAGDRYFLYRQSPGTRGNPASGFSVEAMQGCAREPGAADAIDVPGPGGLYARALRPTTDEPMRFRIYRGLAPAPLRTGDGQPFETTGDLAWAAE